MQEYKIIFWEERSTQEMEKELEILSEYRWGVVCQVGPSGFLLKRRKLDDMGQPVQ
jgi:hypothetical protein